jgi:hypothetical protein
VHPAAQPAAIPTPQPNRRGCLRVSDHCPLTTMASGQAAINDLFGCISNLSYNVNYFFTIFV